jgi:hypothetical protein
MTGQAKYSAVHVQELIKRLNDPLASEEDLPQLEAELKAIINDPESCKEESTWQWLKHIVENFLPHLI